MCQGAGNAGDESEVGIDDVDGVASLVDGIDVERPHNLGCYTRLAVDDAYHLMAFRTCGVGFQTFEHGWRTAPIVFHA